jgi:flavin-dependent dehydrogenase
MYDVIVVGGRIAGSALAMLLGQAGARVLLLERSTFPSVPVSVPVIFANALAILERLGVREAVERNGAIRMYRGGARLGDIELDIPVPQHAGIDFHLGLRREILDTLLIEHAAQQPTVEVRTGFTVTGLLRDGEQVIGVRGRQGGGVEEELRAGVVAGADGRESVVARAVNAPMYRVKPGKNCVYYAYYRNFGDHGQPMTYSYRGEGYAVLTFNADNGLTAVSLGAQPEEWSHFKRDATGEFERRWRAIPELAALGHAAERVGPVKGHGPRASFYRVPYGPGWLLVGDAGYYKDPCTGQGIYDALRSAELASAAWSAWRAGVPWKQAMRGYQHTRDRETKALYQLTFESSKIPKRAKLNPVERLVFRMIAGDQEYAAQLAGIYNGASAPDGYVGLRGGTRLLARFTRRPAALRWTRWARGANRS